jgi:hypothetical protein
MRNPRSGSALMEGVLFLPVLLLLLLGTIEFGRITFVYFQLQKILNNYGSTLAKQSAANFCDESDAVVAAARNFALTGSSSTGGQTLLDGLEADNIRVRLERLSVDGSSAEICDCSGTACDVAAGGRSPEFILVDLRNGYEVRLNVPGLNTSPIIFRPQLRFAVAGGL